MSGLNSSAYSKLTADPKRATSRRSTNAAVARQVRSAAQPAADGRPMMRTEQLIARSRP